MQPAILETDCPYELMQTPKSLPVGNNDDPVIDDENDELAKPRQEEWGNLW
jgi:hypothetical protein